MLEEKFNFAIIKSIFGDYWIGKTKLPIKPGCIFSDFDAALEEAKQHASYEDVMEMESDEYQDETEVIQEDVERFII